MKELDCFGEALIENVYDRTVEDFQKIVAKERTNGLLAQHINTVLKSFSDEQLNAVKEIIPAIVESTLFGALDLLDQEENISIVVNNEGKQEDLSDESDGLGGELFGTHGWIAKYSHVSSMDITSTLMDAKL